MMDGSKGMVGKEGMVVLRAMQDNPFSRDLPIGSNAWAVGPSRSADGHAAGHQFAYALGRAGDLV